MNRMGWFLAAALLCLVGSAWRPALAQSGATASPCTNAQTIGCEYDAQLGWIQLGSKKQGSSGEAYTPPPKLSPAEEQALLDRIAEDRRQAEIEARQAEIEAQVAAEDRARADALTRSATAEQRGTCRYWPSPGEPLPPEVAIELLKADEEDCLVRHNGLFCMAASDNHSQLRIPEADPRKAYRFMKLGCDYGNADACEMARTMCIPE